MLFRSRLKTIHAITGIPPRQVQRLFFPDARTIPRGRAPDSAEWYHGANLILRTDACLIGARYRQLRNQGLASGEALVFAYRDRKVKKRTFRALWIQRINAAARANGMTYNRFISGLKAAGVEVDRKILADLAVTDESTFASLVELAKANQPAAA